MLKQRTPLKRKRDTPRRNEGRVQHGRMKPKGNSTLEEKHVARLRTLKCCVPGCNRFSITHHLMKTPLPHPKRKRRDHRYSVNICNEHHNLHSDSVHLLGSEEKFNAMHGVDLFALALQEWAISVELFEKAKQ